MTEKHTAKTEEIHISKMSNMYKSHINCAEFIVVASWNSHNKYVNKFNCKTHQLNKRKTQKQNGKKCTS